MSLNRGEMKLRQIIITTAVISIFSCVEPPDPQHGLVENYPVVVNMESVFTYAVRGEDYSSEETYNLNFDLTDDAVVNSVLLVTEYAGSIKDTSYIWLLNDQDVVQQSWMINGNQIKVEIQQVDSVYYAPAKVMISTNHLSGVIEYALTLGTASDELAENVPAVINASSLFSFSVNANQYSFDRFYDLRFELHDDDTIETDITTRDWVDLGEASTVVTLFSADTLILKEYVITGDSHILDEIIVNEEMEPKYIGIEGQSVTGVLDVLLRRR